MYDQFVSAEGTRYGSFEVFLEDGTTMQVNETGEAYSAEPGWYWQACFPGCLPDGDPMGPFDTEADAIENAQAQA